MEDELVHFVKHLNRNIRQTTKEDKPGNLQTLNDLRWRLFLERPQFEQIRVSVSYTKKSARARRAGSVCTLKNFRSAHLFQHEIAREKACGYLQ